MPDIAAAEHFIAAHGRVLDRRRFERLLLDGEAAPVRDAVAAYRNPDGGFGHGLEPDGRGPGSQPAAIMLGLTTLHECDAWDEELVAGVLGWLDAHAPAEGGATFVDGSIEGWPAAPWWQPQEGLPASLVSTGPIVAVLTARGVTHPWIDRTAQWLREAAPAATAPYDLLGAVAFANQAAPELLGALEGPVRAVVAEDPHEQGETFSPLLFAPRPQHRAADWFGDRVLEAHVDHLEASQRDDGGWDFNWPTWSPAAEADWRGALTVDALVTIRAYRR